MTLLPEVEAAVLDAVRRDHLSRGKPAFQIRLRSFSRGSVGALANSVIHNCSA